MKERLQDIKWQQLKYIINRNTSEAISGQLRFKGDTSVLTSAIYLLSLKKNKDY